MMFGLLGGGKSNRKGKIHAVEKTTNPQQRHPNSSIKPSSLAHDHFLDNSSVDMSLYTTPSKATIQYHRGVHHEHDWQSQQTGTEFTSEVALMQSKLGGWQAPRGTTTTSSSRPRMIHPKREKTASKSNIGSNASRSSIGSKSSRNLSMHSREMNVNHEENSSGRDGIASSSSYSSSHKPSPVDVDSLQIVEGGGDVNDDSSISSMFNADDGATFSDILSNFEAKSFAGRMAPTTAVTHHERRRMRLGGMIGTDIGVKSTSSDGGSGGRRDILEKNGSGNISNVSGKGTDKQQQSRHGEDCSRISEPMSETSSCASSSLGFSKYNSQVTRRSFESKLDDDGKSQVTKVSMLTVEQPEDHQSQRSATARGSLRDEASRQKRNHAIEGSITHRNTCDNFSSSHLSGSVLEEESFAGFSGSVLVEESFAGLFSKLEDESLADRLDPTRLSVSNLRSYRRQDKAHRSVCSASSSIASSNYSKSSSINVSGHCSISTVTMEPGSNVNLGVNESFSCSNHHGGAPHRDIDTASKSGMGNEKHLHRPHSSMTSSSKSRRNKRDKTTILERTAITQRIGTTQNAGAENKSQGSKSSHSSSRASSQTSKRTKQSKTAASPSSANRSQSIHRNNEHDSRSGSINGSYVDFASLSEHSVFEEESFSGLFSRFEAEGLADRLAPISLSDEYMVSDDSMEDVNNGKNEAIGSRRQISSDPQSNPVTSGYVDVPSNHTDSETPKSCFEGIRSKFEALSLSNQLEPPVPRGLAGKEPFQPKKDADSNYAYLCEASIQPSIGVLKTNIPSEENLKPQKLDSSDHSLQVVSVSRPSSPSTVTKDGISISDGPSDIDETSCPSFQSIDAQSTLPPPHADDSSCDDESWAPPTRALNGSEDLDSEGSHSFALKLCSGSVSAASVVLVDESDVKKTESALSQASHHSRCNSFVPSEAEKFLSATLFSLQAMPPKTENNKAVVVNGEFNNSCSNTETDEQLQVSTVCMEEKEKSFLSSTGSSRNSLKEQDRSGPVDLDESVSDSSSETSSVQDTGEQWNNTIETPPSKPSDCSLFPEVRSPLSQDEDDIRAPFVWTDDQDEDDEFVGHEQHSPNRQRDCTWSQFDEAALDQTYLETMESISASKQQLWSHKLGSPGQLLLTEEEVCRHVKSTEFKDPLPSSTIQGYDDWKWRLELKKRYFAKMHEITMKWKNEEKEESRQPLHSSSHPSQRIDERQHSVDGSQSIMGISMSSTIPTVEVSKPPPREKKRRSQEPKRSWNFLRGVLQRKEDSQSPTTIKSKKKKQKKRREPEVVSLDQFMRISSDEPDDVADMSLSPLNKLGPFTLSSSVPTGYTWAATYMHNLDSREGGPRKLALEHLENERDKQRLAENEKNKLEQREQTRTSTLKNLELDRQRRMNNPRSSRRNIITLQGPSSFLSGIHVDRVCEDLGIYSPATEGSSTRTKSSQEESTFSGKFKNGYRNPITVSTIRDSESLESHSQHHYLETQFSFESSKTGKTSMPSPNSVTQISACIVCHEGERSHISMPCMHFSFCAQCAERLQHTAGICPVCQKNNVVFRRVYT